VADRCRHEPGVERVERGRGEETAEGHAAETVVVTVADAATAAAALELPAVIDGVPVVVEVGAVTDTE
jgi:F420-0:gamma-glutamyl ligase